MPLWRPVCGLVQTIRKKKENEVWFTLSAMILNGKDVRTIRQTQVKHLTCTHALTGIIVVNFHGKTLKAIGTKQGCTQKVRQGKRTVSRCPNYESGETRVNDWMRLTDMSRHYERLHDQVDTHHRQDCWSHLDYQIHRRHHRHCQDHCTQRPKSGVHGELTRVK